MFQKVQIIGNLGGDPKLQYRPDGTAVTNFNVAANRKWKKDDQWHEEVTWFRVSVWRNQAEACSRFLHKGSRVFVEGRLTPDKETGGPRIWETNDGKPRASFEVNAFEVKFLDSKSDGETRPQQAQASQTATEDEIPF